MLTSTPRNGKLEPLGKVAFSGIEAEILLGGEHAPMTVMTMTVTIGQGAPTHISINEDKVFYIVDGRMLFLVDDVKIEVGSGDCLFVGRGVRHGFSSLAGVSRMKLISTPALHDRFFQVMNTLLVPHDFKDVQTVCEEFGQVITGPIVTL